MTDHRIIDAWRFANFSGPREHFECPHMRRRYMCEGLPPGAIRTLEAYAAGKLASDDFIRRFDSDDWVPESPEPARGLAQFRAPYGGPGASAQRAPARPAQARCGVCGQPHTPAEHGFPCRRANCAGRVIAWMSANEQYPVIS